MAGDVGRRPEQDVVAEAPGRRSRSSCRRSSRARSTGRSLPAGLSGCGKNPPVDTWIASTPASTSHLHTCTESSSVLPDGPMPKNATASQCSCGADLHLQVEVVADALADRADDVEHESRPVLERAAVLVLAIVDRRAQELRDQVAVGAVQLDAVEPGLARPPRAFGKRVDRLADVGERHLLAAEAVRRIGLAGRAQAGRDIRCRGCRADGPP